MSESIDTAIRVWAQKRRLPQAHLQRWLELGEADRAALLDLVVRLNLRTAQLATALDLLDEIALRGGRSLGAILRRAELRRIVEGPGSGPERAHATLQKLRELRFPELALTLERLQERIAALRLPRDITMLLPKDLSSDELRIQLSLRHADDLRDALRALEQRADAIARIIAMLGGEERN